MDIFQLRNTVAGYLKKRNRLSLKEQGFIFKRMSEMLNHGFTLAESLDFLGRSQQRSDHKNIFKEMIRKLQGGQPIYEVFNEYRFDQQACAQLYFAERHGFLAEAMKESGRYLLKKDEEQKKLLRTLQYPIILLIVLLFVSFLLKAFLLPRFNLLYRSMGYEPNRAIKSLLHFMQAFPYYVVLGSILLLFLLYVFNRYFQHKSAIEQANFFAHLPIIRSYYKLYQTIFFSREWSFLLKSGFSINEVIEIMITQQFRPLVKESAKAMKDLLTIGYSFSEALSHFQFVERDLVTIVQHGEKNGKLDQELLFYSEFCLETLEEKSMKAFLLIQPIVFLFIGLMIITIYLSIFLPMFQMIESI